MVSANYSESASPPKALGLSSPQAVYEERSRRAVPALDISVPIGSKYTRLSELLSLTTRGVRLDFLKLKHLSAFANHPNSLSVPSLDRAALAASIPVSSLAPFSWIFSKSPRIQQLWPRVSPSVHQAVESQYEAAQRDALVLYVTGNFHKCPIPRVPAAVSSTRALRKIFREQYVLDAGVFRRLNAKALEELAGLSLLTLPLSASDTAVEQFYITTGGSRELVDVEKFHALQISHREDTKKLLGEWLRESRAIVLGNASEIPTNFETPFRTFASLQLRTIVTRTLDQYCGLLKAFAASVASAGRQPACSVLIVNKLIVKSHTSEVEFRLKHSTEAVAERLTRIFKETLVAIRTWPEISDVRDDEQFVREALETLETLLTGTLAQGERTIAEFDKFRPLLSELGRAKGVAENGDVEETDLYVGNLLEIKNELKQKFPVKIIAAPIMAVDCAEVVAYLQEKISECVALVLKSKAARLGSACGVLTTEAENFVAQTRKKVVNEETLLEVKTLIGNFDNSLRASLLDRYAGSKRWFELLYDRKFLFEPEDFRAITAAARAVTEAVHFAVDRKSQLAEEREEIESKFFARREKFVSEISVFPSQVVRFRDLSNYKLADDYLEKIEIFLDTLRRAKQDAADVNLKEQQLGWETSDFDVLALADAQVDPIFRLWGGVCEFNRKQTQWSRSAVLALEISSIETELLRFETLASELETAISDFAAESIRQLRLSVETFRLNMPIVKFLCDERLDEAAWEQISEILGFPVDSDTNYSLVKFLDMGIVDRFDDLAAKILPPPPSASDSS